MIVQRQQILYLVVAAVLLGRVVGGPAPEQMVRIVVRDATPSLAGTFAAEPRTIYRVGARYARIEEAPHPELGVHGLVITNHRDTWIANLVDSNGTHVVDDAENFDVHIPILGWSESSLLSLEYGRELDFISARGIEPIRTEIDGREFNQFEASEGPVTVRILVASDTGVPWAIGIIENGVPVSLIRYDEYEYGLEPNLTLFQRPSGVRFNDAN